MADDRTRTDPEPIAVRIQIEDLRVDTVVGVYASERHVEQTLWLSIAFEYDASEAVAVDQFERAIDYDSLSGALTKFIQQGKFQLIESAASASCEYLLAHYPMAWVEVAVSKPSALERAETVKAIKRLSRESDSLP
jgi:FolB domain-containing protein